MNIKSKTSWSNAESILLILCIASAWLMTGAYFHGFFSNYYKPLFVIFGISAIWFVYGRVNKTKKQGSQN